MFGCKNLLRYRRERASQSFGVNHSFLFIRLFSHFHLGSPYASEPSFREWSGLKTASKHVKTCSRLGFFKALQMAILLRSANWPAKPAGPEGKLGIRRAIPDPRERDFHGAPAPTVSRGIRAKLSIETIKFDHAKSKNRHYFF